MCGLDRRGLGRGIGAVIVAVAAALNVAGCKSREQLPPECLQGKRNCVGGGMTINWQAPEAGTVYLVERTTGKLVQTQSLEKGAVYRFAVQTVVEAADMEDLLGINIDDAQFLLYFEPGSHGASGNING